MIAHLGRRFFSRETRPVCILLACALLLGLPIQHTPANPLGPWIPGFEKATQRAIHSGKDILVAFTIRRMDAASRHFETHFLLQPTFAETLSPSFELVWVDSSEHGGDQEDSPAFMLRRQFEVTSFPAVVLTNPLGQPYAYTGLRPGSLENYLSHIALLQEKNLARQALLVRAQASRGPARAALLASAIPELGQHRTAKFYGDIMREILALDPAPEHESTRTIRRQLAGLDFARKMQELDRELRWTEMVDLINQHIADQNLSGAHRQAALMNRLDVHRQQDDLPRALQTLEEIVRINPSNRHGQQASLLLADIRTHLKNQATLANPEIKD